MRNLDVSYDTAHVGALRISDGVKPSVEFTYAQAWIAEGFPIDPELPLSSAPFSRDGSLFGAFADSAPDRWGRGLLARSRPTTALGEADYLLLVDDFSRQGGLRFRDSNGQWMTHDSPIPVVTDVEELRVAAQEFENSGGPALRALVAAGAGTGGARPKAVVRDQDDLWLAKFSSRHDPNQAEVAEDIIGHLARRAGIKMSPTRLITNLSEPVLLIKRFDRIGERRLGFLSANSLLQSLVDPTRDQFDYLELADVLPEWSNQPTKDLHQLWRRIAFGCLVRNTDDHMRNHGFIRAATGWELSPAYDINTDVEQAHTSSSAVDGHDGPGKLDALIRNADYFRLDDTAAITILKEINDAVDSIDDVVADYPTSDTTKQLQELLNSRPTR